MNPILRVPSEHRLARLTTWLMLWIAKAAAVLGLLAPTEARAWLAARTRETLTILVLRAIRRVPAPARRRGYRRAAPPGAAMRLKECTLRAVVGRTLRHAVRGRSLAAKIEALRLLLRDAPRVIAAIERRLRRGFTKLRTLRPAPQRTLFTASFAPPPLSIADTS